MNQTFYGCASITGAQRTQIINKQQIPGPGTYDPTLKDNTRIPQWTLKPKIEYTSCFHNFKQSIPAPGTYQISTNINQRKKGKQKQIKNNKDKDRNYIQRCSPIIALQIPSFVDERNGFSFGYRDQIVVKERSPGPIYHLGEMEDQIKKKKALLNKTNGFGYAQRNKMQRNAKEIPGPGNYSPSPQKMYASSGSWTFSKSSRKNKYRQSNPLGPGQYSPKLMNSQRSCKLKGRYNQTKLQNYDACPGSYEIPDTKSKKSAIFRAPTSLNKSKNLLNNSNPSPFSYDPLNNSLKKGGYSLGRKLNSIDQNIQNPGPGSYEIQTRIDDKNGGYMSKRPLQRKKVSDTQDNFYKYNPINEAVSYKYPQFSFSQSTSTLTSKSNNKLGPGSYDILRKSSGQTYSIGKDPRFKPLQKQKQYGNIITQKDYYSSFGYMPPYLRGKDKNKSKEVHLASKISEKQNCSQAEQN